MYTLSPAFFLCLYINLFVLSLSALHTFSVRSSEKQNRTVDRLLRDGGGGKRFLTCSSKIPQSGSQLFSELLFERQRSWTHQRTIHWPQPKIFTVGTKETPYGHIKAMISKFFYFTHPEFLHRMQEQCKWKNYT